MSRLAYSLFIVATLTACAGPSAYVGMMGGLASGIPSLSGMAGGPPSGRAEQLQTITALKNKGDYEGALVEAEKLVEVDAARNQQAPSQMNGAFLSQSAEMAGRLHRQKKNYPRAIQLYLLAQGANPSARLLLNAGVGMGQMQLAELYEESGDDKAALAEYLDLLKLSNSRDAFQRGILLGRIGQLQLKLKDVDAAKMYLELAADMNEHSRKAGAEHLAPEQSDGNMAAYSRVLGAMAMVKDMARTQRQDVSADGLQGQALPGGSGLGQESDAFGKTLAALGEVYFQKSDRAGLGVLITERASKWDTGASAEGNVSQEVLYLKLAQYAVGLGMDSEAQLAYGKALDLNRKRVLSVAARATVRRVWDTFTSRRDILASFLSYAATRQKDAALTRQAIALIADTKGMATYVLGERQRSIALSDDADLKNKARELDELESQLADTSRFAGPNGMHAWGDIQGKMIPLEMALLEKMPTLTPPQEGEKLLSAASKQLQARGEGLLGFVRLKPYDFKRQTSAAQVYFGYALGGGKPKLVNLGSAEAIDANVTGLRRALAGKDRPAVRSVGVSLHRQLLSPLMEGNPNRLVIDPDGMLSLLPFEVLQDPRGRQLIQTVPVRYVGSIRILATSETAGEAIGPALVVANPSFNAQFLGGLGAQPDAGQRAASGVNLTDLRFSQLPDTETEAKEVANLLQENRNLESVVLLGDKATAESTKVHRRPSILHIATHGFMLKPVELRLTSDNGMSATYRVRLHGLQAGLAMAGANSAQGTGKPTGILFAKDIERLDLTGTELTVLSACDTGNGTIDVGEGVDSLRRALEVAGSRSSLTTLWPIPSRETVQLMKLFYKEVSRGKDKATALQQAKKVMMTMKPDPFYWGAFILSGDS